MKLLPVVVALATIFYFGSPKGYSEDAISSQNTQSESSDGRGPGGGGGGGGHPGGGGGGGVHPGGGGGGGNPGGWHPGGGGGGNPGGWHPGGGGGGVHPGGGGGGIPGGGGGGNHGGNGGGGNGGNHGGNGGGGNGGNHGGNGGGGNGGNHGGNGGGGNGGNHGGNGGGGNGGNHGGNGGGNGGHNGNIGHNGNNVPPGHVQDIQHSQQKVTTVMKTNVRVKDVVTRHTTIYETRYRDVFVKRINIYNGYRFERGPIFRAYWGPRWHFWGYGWRSEVIDIREAFWNPCFYWFYVGDGDWDDYYFRTWYGPIYDQYPGFYERFRRPWVFYPTQAWQDLAYGTSVWEAERQLQFRQAMADLTVDLENTLSQELGQTIMLDEGSVEIDHYQLLDNSVVIDGIVYADGNGYPYKAYLDLMDPSQDVVFAPVDSGEQPSYEDTMNLNTLNDRITTAGGVLEDAPQQ